MFWKEIASCSCCTWYIISQMYSENHRHAVSISLSSPSCSRCIRATGGGLGRWSLTGAELVLLHIKSILAFGVGKPAGLEGGVEEGEHMSDTSWLFHEAVFEVLTPTEDSWGDEYKRGRSLKLRHVIISDDRYPVWREKSNESILTYLG